MVSRILAMAVLLLAAGPAAAAEISVLSTTALRGVMQTLVPDFERASGNKIAIAFMPSGAAKKLIDDGAVKPDVAIVTDTQIAELIRSGKMAAGSGTNIARLAMGVAVRAGAPKPDISTPEKLKAALLAAKTVAYTDPEGGGASGVLVAKMLERLGIADAVRAKARLTTGPVGELVASGEGEIGMQQIPELKAVPGVEIVGPLPGNLQTVTVLAAGVSATAKEPAAARAFVQFLTAPDAVTVITATGMDKG